MSLQTSSWKFRCLAAITQIRKYTISLVGVCILLLFTSGSVFAHPTQVAFSRSQLDFVPLEGANIEGANTVPPEIQNAMNQVPPDKLQAAKNAYELAKENPEGVQVQNFVVNPSQDASLGVVPQVFIPGIGQFTIRVYAWQVANAVPVPYGFGLYFPLTTAKNLVPVGGAVATAIAVAIATRAPGLAPFSPVISVTVANILNTIPNYIINHCVQELQEEGGGFTVAFANPTPIPVCGPLPQFAF